MMTPDLPAAELAIVEMTNAFRAEQGLGALQRNAVLDQVARNFAAYLARTGRFSHTADGRQPGERGKAGGYAYCQFAENLALNGDSRGFRARQLARAAVEGWKNSPGHRRNMLGAHATEIGVGIAKAPNKPTYLSVQLFGRPQALQFSYTIRNETRASVSYRVGDGDRDRLPARTIVTYTTCKPEAVTFDLAGRKEPVRPGRDDVFVIKASPSGRPVVIQQPRTN